MNLQKRKVQVSTPTASQHLLHTTHRSQAAPALQQPLHSSSSGSTSALGLALCTQGEPRREPPDLWAGLGHPPPSSACQQHSSPSFFGKDSNNSLFRLNTTSPEKEEEPVPQPPAQLWAEGLSAGKQLLL